MSKIAVLGAGAWGTALAMQISHQHQVALWARNSGHVSGMRKSRANPLYLGDFPFQDKLSVEDDLGIAINGADLILSVVPTAGFRNILKDIKKLQSNQPIIWAHKGLEPYTAKLPHEVAQEELGPNQYWGALSGPSFAAELVRGLPTAVTLAANNAEFALQAANLIHGNNLRVYNSTDVVGVSVLLYTLRLLPWIKLAASNANSALLAANVTAVGKPRTSSAAKLGPDNAPQY